MRDLTFECEALLAEARSAFAPSVAARERIRAGVAARVAAAAAASALAAGAPMSQAALSGAGGSTAGAGGAATAGAGGATTAGASGAATSGAATAGAGGAATAGAGGAATAGSATSGAATAGASGAATAGVGSAIGSSALVKLAAAISLAAALVGSGWGLWRLFAEVPEVARPTIAAPASGPASPSSDEEVGLAAELAAEPAAPLGPAPAESVAPIGPTAESAAPITPVARPASARPDRPAEERAESSSSDLARELALIRAAQRSLASGRPAAALATLGRHQREVRAPQMEREAWLLRAEALCRAGHISAGLELLESARARWPRATALAAVSQACAADR